MLKLGQGCDKGESAGIGDGDWCIVFPSGAAGTFLSRLISTGANRNQKATWPSSRALVSSLVCIGVRSGLPVCVCVCVYAGARAYIHAHVSEGNSVSIRIDTQSSPSSFCLPPPASLSFSLSQSFPLSKTEIHIHNAYTGTRTSSLAGAGEIEKELVPPFELFECRRKMRLYIRVYMNVCEHV